MPFVSVTRLQVRSVRFLPSFVIHTLRSVRQVKEAQGLRDGALLIDRHWTFWTMTSWDNQNNVRSYMRAGRTGKQCRTSRLVRRGLRGPLGSIGNWFAGLA